MNIPLRQNSLILVQKTLPSCPADITIRDYTKPKEELIVTFAGPLVNIVLALITGLFISLPDTSALARGIVFRSK
jgi:hypothetical protein